VRKLTKQQVFDKSVLFSAVPACYIFSFLTFTNRNNTLLTRFAENGHGRRIDIIYLSSAYSLSGDGVLRGVSIVVLLLLHITAT
jgi:hypothetical protein